VKLASDLRTGMAIRVERDIFRVTEAVAHTGSGQMKGFVHARLRNVRTGHLTERRFRPEDRFEEVELDRRVMEYLYDEGDNVVLMHPQSFEQVFLAKASLGPFGRFVRPGQRLEVEFLGEEPLGVAYPKVVDLRVTMTAEPIHMSQDTNVFKEAVLENGLELLVPQFVRQGDLVRVDVESGKYVDRVRQ
jgi:elongation factor P